MSCCHIMSPRFILQATRIHPPPPPLPLLITSARSNDCPHTSKQHAERGGRDHRLHVVASSQWPHHKGVGGVHWAAGDYSRNRVTSRLCPKHTIALLQQQRHHQAADDQHPEMTMSAVETLIRAPGCPTVATLLRLQFLIKHHPSVSAECFDGAVAFTSGGCPDVHCIRVAACGVLELDEGIRCPLGAQLTQLCERVSEIVEERNLHGTRGRREGAGAASRAGAYGRGSLQYACFHHPRTKGGQDVGT